MEFVTQEDWKIIQSRILTLRKVIILDFPMGRIYYTQHITNDNKDPKVVLINPKPRRRSQFWVFFRQEFWCNIMLNMGRQI